MKTMIELDIFQEMKLEENTGEIVMRPMAEMMDTPLDFIDEEDFIVYLGDNILEECIKKIMEKFEGSGMECGLLLCKVKNPQPFGIAVLNADGYVVEVEEKPKNPRSDLAIVGVYLFKKSIFDYIKRIKQGRNNEFQLTDAIKLLLDENAGASVYGATVTP